MSSTSVSSGVASASRRYAGLWKRALAFALDYILIAVYLGLLVGLGLAANRAAPSLTQALFGNPLSGQLTGFSLITLPVTLYFALFEASAWQATWGERRLHLRVVGPAGERLSVARSLGRTALKFIPWELAHTCIWQITFAGPDPSPLIMIGFAVVWLLVGANIVSLWLSPTQQTLYDRLAGTHVIKRLDRA